MIREVSVVIGQCSVNDSVYKDCPFVRRVPLTKYFKLVAKIEAFAYYLMLYLLFFKANTYIKLIKYLLYLPSLSPVQVKVKRAI